jgi:hypothetical protein
MLEVGGQLAMEKASQKRIRFFFLNEKWENKRKG